jgi:hypothetical protein
VVRELLSEKSFLGRVLLVVFDGIDLAKSGRKIDLIDERSGTSKKGETSIAR